MAEEQDPIVQALPPATDYLTYLTLLEYQLTPARLPTLHKLLQDEVLTTNIGWDLVQLLLPMLPQSLECLQDIARLGNPREVILRVSETLMQLQPEDEDEEGEDQAPESSATHEADAGDAKPESAIGNDDAQSSETHSLPRHVLKFNSLVAMLSVLHSRIQTKSPSRFLATSLQAVLEAYTLMPTNETTIALLEFFRDVSPSKRPAPPPRAASESSILRVAEASAPDPEAEVQSPNPSNNNEPALIKRFLQFGLIELIKSYILSFSGPMAPGMSWTVRLQEKLQPRHLAGRVSETEVFTNSKQLRERDMIMGKITALSRDFGLDDKQLLTVVSQPADQHPQPLDFDEPPKKVEEIPLERHGALLLLAARAAMAELFSSGQVTPIAVFPNLAQIFDNFVGGHNTPDEIAFGQPQALLDSLLTLTVFSMQKSIGEPSNETEFRRFILSLTACTTRQTYNSIRRIPGTIVHSHPSHIVRFKTIRQFLEDDRYQLVKDSAIGWLKDEILEASKNSSSSPESSIFCNPHYFSVLFPLLFNSSELLLNVSSDIVASWIKFSQTFTPSIHAALSLYYILISSSTLRTQLQLEKTYIYFRNRFLEPLKSLLHAFERDLTRNGGEGKIESAVGENMCQVGMARSVSLVSHALEQVEDAMGDVFVVADDELQEPSTDDIARVDKIRKETAL
ncbi:YAP-binding/ALF4/Glomulin [Aspergillus alliaceus]|uniref:YAP-binding/ALF4/Glomulin n=1 Tax=Petromyces alliaceus TaxID=209559 RepID=A0A5N7CNH5_PETAA|nr:YAP-binding/ALF4/Glomulin [Aspergillus alliaceus]